MFNKESNNTLKDIPKIGKEYHFFDDGKTGQSRRYMVTIKEVIPFDEMKDKDLINAWKEQSEYCSWLYSKTTDYFIKGISPKYDEDPLWFIRTKDGGWFSFDYPHYWMSGELDIDNEMWNEIMEFEKQLEKESEL